MKLNRREAIVGAVAAAVSPKSADKQTVTHLPDWKPYEQWMHKEAEWVRYRSFTEPRQQSLDGFLV